MANTAHLEVLDQGRTAWNKWRKTTLEVPDLAHANATERDLSGFNFTRARLDHTNFERCSLRSANFTFVRGLRTNFRSADLARAQFTGAHLTEADFSFAHMEGSVFGSASLHGVIFDGAVLWSATFGFNLFADVSFRETVGLEEVIHEGPSSLGIDTFFASQGLPESFLRGCGVPQDFLTYASSLTGKPIQYYSCFLSYSSQDDTFVRRLHADLQQRRIRTWFAPEDLKIGDRFHSRIDESIRIHDKLVLILSQHSIDSAWVRREVEAALDREDREKRDVLFPIRLDDMVFASTESWAKEIQRSRHIGDFRNWKTHDDYAAALDRLVRDLKKEGPIVMR